MNAHVTIPADMLAAAPRAWVSVGPGMRVRSIDPSWMRATRTRLATAAMVEVSVSPFGPEILHSPAQRIIADVCRIHDVALQDLLSPSRKPELCQARYHAAHELSRLGLSLGLIGRLLRRDHTSILAGLRKWPKRASRLGIPCEPLPARTVVESEALETLEF